MARLVRVCLGLDQVGPRLSQFHFRPSQAYPMLTWVRPGLVQSGINQPKTDLSFMGCTIVDMRVVLPLGFLTSG